MALTANISLSVPTLPENDVWFANTQAWNNYWLNATGLVTLNPVATTIYTPNTFDTTIKNVDLIIEGVTYTVVVKAVFDSLLAKVNNLDLAFQGMRTELKQGGLITNAQ